MEHVAVKRKAGSYNYRDFRIEKCLRGKYWEVRTQKGVAMELATSLKQAKTKTDKLYEFYAKYYPGLPFPTDAHK